jgi:general secretion pathway protein G
LNQLRSDEDRKNVVERGFTLVELLIVIVILGILAGIVVFAVSNLTEDAAKNACATEASTVESAAEAFKARAQRYPQSMNELKNDTPVNGVTVNALLKSDPKAWQQVVDAANPLGAEKFQLTFDAAAPVGETFVITRGASCTA